MDSNDTSTPKDWDEKSRREYVESINRSGPWKVKVRAWGDTNPVADQLGCPYWCQQPNKNTAQPSDEFCFGGIDFASVCSPAQLLNRFYYQTYIIPLIVSGQIQEDEEEKELVFTGPVVAKA